MFDKLIRDGLALADRMTASLQPQVTHQAWIGNDGFGDSQYAPPQSYPALVERKDRLMRNKEGQEIRSEHVVSFLRPVAPQGAEGRDEPIDPRDIITLPDGSTGPIAAVETFVDPATGAGYFHIVALGAPQ